MKSRLSFSMLFAFTLILLTAAAPFASPTTVDKWKRLKFAPKELKRWMFTSYKKEDDGSYSLKFEWIGSGGVALVYNLCFVSDLSRPAPDICNSKLSFVEDEVRFGPAKQMSFDEGMPVTIASIQKKVYKADSGNADVKLVCIKTFEWSFQGNKWMDCKDCDWACGE